MNYLEEFEDMENDYLVFTVNDLNFFILCIQFMPVFLQSMVWSFAGYYLYLHYTRKKRIIQ